MISNELADVRRRFVADAQTGLRRPAVAVGTGLVFVVLGAAPLVPAGRTLLGVPATYTATWASIYLVLSAVVYVLFRARGPVGRVYAAVSAIETVVWLHGVVVLGALSGRLSSPWLVLAMLGFVALAGTSGFSDRPQVGVAIATPLVAFVAYLPLGFTKALGALLLMSLGFAGFAIVASAVERFLVEQVQREQLRARVVTLERELERQHIARDLHDSLGSTLALVGMYSTLIEENAHRPDELRQLSAMLREASRDGLDELRALLEAVSPNEPTVGGLVASFERLLRRIPDPTIASLRVDAPKEASLEDLVRVSLIRVFQEATANALRHGKARTIATAIAVTDQRIVLSVHDDGTGFDPGAVSEGRGLVGMRARASELGGELRVHTSPGHGTQLHFDVPRVRES